MNVPLDPEEVTARAAPTAAEVPAETRMGPVWLTVSDLARSIEYYRNAVGLQAVDSDGGRATLGSGGMDLLVLTEERGVPPSNGYCGLYHFALLVPERRDLARWLAHAARDRVPLTGMADHYVSEALYLSDPDDHGIEIYWDRPRQVWEGQVARRMTTVRLDVDDLVREVAGEGTRAYSGLPSGTVMGHVHLRVAEIPGTIRFYRDVLGFGLMATFGNQAAFLSAGGYHHHLGANIWESAGSPPAPPGTARLTRVNVQVPSAGDVDRMATHLEYVTGRKPEQVEGGVLTSDPSGNPVGISAA